MRTALALVVFIALPCAAQLTQTFSEAGYANNVELPGYTPPNQPAWTHLNCHPATENCLTTSSGRVAPISSGGARRYGVAWSNFDWPADHQATVAYTSLGSSNQNRCLGAGVRMSGSPSSITGYMALYCHSGTVSIGKVVANTWTEIRPASHILAAADSINLKVAGATLTTTITISGAPTIYTDTDSSIASGRPGISGYFSGTAGVSSIFLDSWSADYATASDRPAQRFVSMSGGSSNTNGESAATAWPIGYAFDFCADGMIRAGDKIWLLDGTHTGIINMSCDGTAQSPIHVRAYPGANPIFQGDLGGPAGQIVQITGDYLYLQGAEATEQDGGRRWAQPLSGDNMEYRQGFYIVSGTGSKLIHCLVHNTAQGVFFNAPNSEVYGCISVYNGWRSGGRGSGHGIYSQLKVPRAVTNNVTGKHMGLGIQVSGEDTDQFTATGNTCFEPGFIANGLTEERCFLVQSISTVELTINGATGNPVQISTTADHNLSLDQYVQISSVGGCTSINGNWKVHSIVNATTFTVKNYAEAVQGPCNASYTSGGTADTGQHTTRSTLVDNLGFSSSIAGNPGGLTLHSNNICDVGTITGNYLVGFATNGNIDSTCTNVTNEDNFYVGSGGTSRVTWNPATTYTDNTYLTAEPTSGQVVRTGTSIYEAEWCLVTIVNYEAATNSYPYNPSGCLKAGDWYEYIDVQNPKVIAGSGQWNSGTISLPLNLTAVMAIKGGDWGPPVMSIAASGGSCTATLEEGMFVSDLSEESVIRISEAGHTSLNGDWTILTTPAGDQFTFSCPATPNGTHNGGLAQWAGPLLNEHTSNKFNAFMLRRKRESKTVTLKLHNAFSAATHVRLKMGLSATALDWPTRAVACAYQEVCTFTVDNHFVGRDYYQWEMATSSAFTTIVGQSDPQPLVVN